ncbi:MAG: PQQ-dependent sugar dehydrogenase [Gammaproteobacteria bacterium]
MNSKLLLAISISIAALPACTFADDPSPASPRVSVITVAGGLEHPWSVAFLPGGDLLVTERPGRLRLVRDGALVGQPVAGTPAVVAQNQGGLLDVVLHPAFAENGFVYLTYAAACEDGATTAVGRGVWKDGALEGFTELFRADACAPGGRHHGSRLVFDRDGYLFMTVGERGRPDWAQDKANNAGATLRLHDDGTIPDDNPFVGRDGHDANWTWGNRNPQGMAVHPATGEIWQHEHGPRGGDEINIVRKGANYGWPQVTFGREYSGATITEVRTRDDIEPPLKQWTPSIAPSGLAIYGGGAFPEWRHDLFVGALSHQHLARVRFEEGREVASEKLLEGIGRVRDVKVGPDGFIYLAIDARDGRVVRLEPADD